MDSLDGLRETVARKLAEQRGYRNSDHEVWNDYAQRYDPAWRTYLNDADAIIALLPPQGGALREALEEIQRLGTRELGGEVCMNQQGIIARGALSTPTLSGGETSSSSVAELEAERDEAREVGRFVKSELDAAEVKLSAALGELGRCSKALIMCRDGIEWTQPESGVNGLKLLIEATLAAQQPSPEGGFSASQGAVACEGPTASQPDTQSSNGEEA